MQISSIKTLSLPEVKVIQFKRFKDERGYFSESFRLSDFKALDFLSQFSFPQHNESFSHTNVVRGLHFQWDPPMGKLVRTILGRMVDIVMDIRKGSPNYGKVLLYDMSVNPQSEFSEWIWVPPGFAHGNFFTEDTYVQYFCTQEYKPDSEAGISVLANDLDWSLCSKELKDLFESIKPITVISGKDKNNYSLKNWSADPHSENFK